MSEIKVKCDFRSSFVHLHQKIIIVSVFNGWRKIKHESAILIVINFMIDLAFSCC